MQYEEILPVTNVLMFKKELWFKDYALRLEKWFKGKRVGPVRIDAEITRRCNSNCIFCSRRASPINLTEESKKIEMPKERWIELARETGELGTREWNISGVGEPMCRPNVVLETMKMIKAYDMFGELTTNGMLWKEEYIKEVVDMDWDSVCISIDGPNARIHELLRRVKGAFKRATWTAKRFAYWKKKLHSELPSITINVVLNKLNYQYLPDMVKLAHDVGAQAIFVEPMVLFSLIAEHLKLTQREISELPQIIQKTRDLGEKYGILPTISCVGVEREFDEKLVEKSGKARKLLLDDVKRNRNDTLLNVPCYAPWLFLMVRVDGTVLHCGEMDTPVDNIRNKSLRDVWFGKKFEEVRSLFRKGKLPSSCEKCRPNIINDMRQIRKSIVKYRNIELLQNEILDLLKENKKLRDELLLLRRKLGSYEDVKKLKRELECEKELLRYKNSISFKISQKIGNTSFGRLIKKVFGVYV
jgi:MoaA/NifB/PqqE/SkfB family radical SAM enzyme